MFIVEFICDFSGALIKSRAKIRTDWRGKNQKCANSVKFTNIDPGKCSVAGRLNCVNGQELVNSGNACWFVCMRVVRLYSLSHGGPLGGSEGGMRSLSRTGCSLL